MMRVLRYFPALVLVCACSHDWDSLDPRLGSGGVPGTGGSGGNAGAGNASGTAGTTSGGNGGTPTGGGTGGIVSGGGSSGSGGTPTGGGTGGTPTGGGTGGVDAGPGSVTYTATIAECIATTNPNPPACEATAGAGHMTIDSSTAIVDGGPGNYQTAGFVRFELDAAIAAKTVSAVTLRMTVGNQTNSNSSQTGTINAVSCFTLADLSVAAPAKQGGTISPNQGAVNQQDVVNFPLPVGTVTANQPVCLGIYAVTSVTDGVDYGNTKGSTPPQLIIDYL
jgi:hypothetical protein